MKKQGQPSTQDSPNLCIGLPLGLKRADECENRKKENKDVKKTFQLQNKEVKKTFQLQKGVQFNELQMIQNKLTSYKIQMAPTPNHNKLRHQKIQRRKHQRVKKKKN